MDKYTVYQAKPSVATLKNLNKETIAAIFTLAYDRVERQIIKLLSVFIYIARRIRARVLRLLAVIVRIARRAREIVTAKAAEAFARLQRFLASSNVGPDTPTDFERRVTKARNAGPQIASPFTPQLKALKAAKAARLTPALARQKAAVGL